MDNQSVERHCEFYFVLIGVQTWKGLRGVENSSEDIHFNPEFVNADDVLSFSYMSIYGAGPPP